MELDQSWEKQCYEDRKKSYAKVFSEQQLDPLFGDDASQIIDKNLKAYQETIQRSINNYDIVDIGLRNMDCVYNRDSSYERAVLEEFVVDSKPQDIDYTKGLPQIVPYLTLDEYTEYFPENNQLAFPYVYSKSEEHDYYNKVRELQNKLKNNQEQRVEIEHSILEMGWNPYVPMNGENLKRARERQGSYLNRNSISMFDIAELSEFHTDLSDDILQEFELGEKLIEPVYIVLSYTNTIFGKLIKGVEHSTYTHAALALEPTLAKMYSFNFQPKSGINGLSIESIDEYHDQNGDAKLKILVCFISTQAKRKLMSILKWFEDHIEKTRYGFSNLFNIVVNKSQDIMYNTSMVCSQFVDSIMKLCNIDITGTTSNLVTPKTFEKIDTKETKNCKVYSIYQGWKSKYNWREIKRKTLALLRLSDSSNIEKQQVSTETAIHLLFERKIENFDICIPDRLANLRLDVLRQTITPVAIIQEMQLPIGFTRKGDLYINKKEDLQLEYNEAHKLLSMYDQTNIEGMKHELSRLFYLNSIIEKKLKKMRTNKTDEYKELIDLRARILNDFKTYFKIVKLVEPGFDFTSYIKNTEYYNKRIVVDNNTLKYSGKLIKDFLKNIT